MRHAALGVARRALAQGALPLALAALLLACSAEHEAPPPSAGGAQGVDAVAAAGEARVAIRGAFATAPPGSDAAVYAALIDESGKGDRLVAASCPDAAGAMLHGLEERDGRVHMVHHAGGIAIPPGGVARLAPGGDHVMIHQLTGRFAPGSEIALALEFERAGRVELVVPVVALAAVERLGDALPGGDAP